MSKASQHLFHVDEQRATELRATLVAELERDGELRTPAWRAAFCRVPRHMFLPRIFLDKHNDHGVAMGWRLVTPTHVERASQWLGLVYRNDTLVTQLDGHDEATSGYPTSSSTHPGLMARMLEDLMVDDGMQVLEIGAGTGYNAALLCERLGSDNVVTVDVDQAIARQAKHNLHTAGYRPTLVAADGLLGYPQHAPYDRVVATCSVRQIPTAWVEQTRPDGLILTTLGGGLAGYGLVRLTVTSHDTASGRFLPGDASFMFARSHAVPQVGPRLNELPEEPDERRPTNVDPHLFTDNAFRFTVQLALPEVGRVDLLREDGPVFYLIDWHSDSWAAAWTTRDDGHVVDQGGPRRLWDIVEQAHIDWVANDRPHPSRHGLTVNPSRQTVWLGAPDGPSVDLPVTPHP